MVHGMFVSRRLVALPGLLREAPARVIAAALVAGALAAAMLAPSPAGATILPGKMYSEGGPVVRDPKLFAIYWGRPWAIPGVFTRSLRPPYHPYTADQVLTYLRLFLQNVGGSPWFNTLTQYCGGDIGARYDNCNGDLRGRYLITNPTGMHTPAREWIDTGSWVPGTYNEPDDGMPISWVYHELRRAVSYFGNPDPRNAIFIVFTPPHKTALGYRDGDSLRRCAMHGRDSDDGSPPWVIYIPFTPEILRCGWPRPDNEDDFGHGHLDTLTVVLSHEIGETVTDPTVHMAPLRGWADAQDQEMGNKCNYEPTDPYWLPFGEYEYSFAVQRTFSNAAGPDGDCVSTTSTEVEAPQSVGFPDTAVGSASPSAEVTLANQGPVELHVDGVSLSGATEFEIASDGCSHRAVTIEQGRNSCRVRVRFVPRPPVVGAREATLTFSSDAVGGPRTVRLTGRVVGSGGEGHTWIPCDPDGGCLHKPHGQPPGVYDIEPVR